MLLFITKFHLERIGLNRGMMINRGKKLYTDGSKTDHGIGFGVFGEFNTSKRLWNHATIFQAEALAINFTAKQIIKEKIKNNKINIFSDSQSVVLKALQNNKITKTIFNCIQNLEKAGENNDITITWIPRHEGHEENEQADSLAKKAAGDYEKCHINDTINKPQKLRSGFIRN